MHDFYQQSSILRLLSGYRFAGGREKFGGKDKILKKKQAFLPESIRIVISYFSQGYS